MCEDSKNTVSRSQVVEGIKNFRQEWEKATGEQLVDSDLCYSLIDVTAAIGLTPAEQTEALGYDPEEVVNAPLPYRVVVSATSASVLNMKRAARVVGD